MTKKGLLFAFYSHRSESKSKKKLVFWARVNCPRLQLSLRRPADTVNICTGVQPKGKKSNFGAISPPQSRRKEKGKSGHSVIMIPPQVHLRRPCYDFSILYKIRFEQVLACDPHSCPRGCTRHPEISPDPAIGWSDGRCVQRAGTKSTQYGELHLLRIPR